MMWVVLKRNELTSTTGCILFAGDTNYLDKESPKVLDIITMHILSCSSRPAQNLSVQIINHQK